MRNPFFSLGLLMIIFSSCTRNYYQLRTDAKIDTLNISMELKYLQPGFRDAVLQKMNQYVQQYNGEQHAFRLALNGSQTTNTYTLNFNPASFVTRRQSHLALGITALGVATPFVLFAVKAPFALAWVYIPNARVSVRPKLSEDIVFKQQIPRIAIVSTGMYRSFDKQVALQSSKILPYVNKQIGYLEKTYDAASSEQHNY